MRCQINITRFKLSKVVAFRAFLQSDIVVQALSQAVLIQTWNNVNIF